MNVGDRVRIGRMHDEIGDPRYTGHVGTVTAVKTFGEDVGESEEHPFIIVKFDRTVMLPRMEPLTTFPCEDLEDIDWPRRSDGGFDRNDHDGFWPEELEEWL